MTHTTQPIPKKRLGKGAPIIDPRTLKLSKYLLPIVPPAPKRMNYSQGINVYPMYGNDVYGNCTIAASAHHVEVWTNKSRGSPDLLSMASIMKAYEDVGGYVPGDPTTDNGCFMLDVLNYWRKTGIGGHKIDAFVSVDPTNHEEMAQAIWLFGGVYLGLQLPISAQQGPWKVPSGGPVGDGSPGSWGGHCVPCVAYRRGHPGNRMLVVTWGELQVMGWDFVNTYADEAYGVLSMDWIESNGQAPNGFDLVTLKRDLQNL